MRPPRSWRSSPGSGRGRRSRTAAPWPSACARMGPLTESRRRFCANSDNGFSHMKVRARDPKQVWREEFESSRTRRTDDIETSTISGVPVKPLYTSDDLPVRGEEMPGQYPYTRGIHPTGYRGRLWTMRQFSGFATAEETNKRYKYLLANGQTGLSVAFDMPTLMEQDSDAPTSRGEVGHCGVAIDSLADMETLFDGIPLGEITTSMTINSPAAILLCMYIAVAEKQGVAAAKLGGTLQNDILKEFIAQKEFIFPPAPSMRLVVDSIEYCAKEVPKWNTISISGYHIREAGSTAAQELAFTLADGMAYVDACLQGWMHIDDFASRLSFFFDAHIDFFEEIAKFRAARRIWARWMRERYGAQQERSWKLRFHAQTAGVSLTAQQPELNIARTAIE